jgi:hypothetical protein
MTSTLLVQKNKLQPDLERNSGHLTHRNTLYGHQRIKAREEVEKDR